MVFCFYSCRSFFNNSTTDYFMFCSSPKTHSNVHSTIGSNNKFNINFFNNPNIKIQTFFFQSSKIINIHPKSISDLIKYLSFLLDLRVSAQFLWSAPVANAWGTACASASPSAPARHGPSPWDLRLPAPRMRPSSAPHRPGVEKPLQIKWTKDTMYVYIYIHTANAWALPGTATTTGNASASASASASSSASSSSSIS